MAGYAVEALDCPRGLLCAECGMILNKAVQTSDGFRLCQECFHAIERLPGCKSDTTGISVLDEDGNPCCYPDIAVRREVKKLRVICNNKKYGCDFIGLLESYFGEHVGGCKYEPCPNKEKGCKELVPPIELHKHLAEECQFRAVKCRHCGVDTMHHLILAHYDECSKYPMECPLCDQTVPSEQMELHRGSYCPKVECLCGQILTRNGDGESSMASHLNNPALLAAHVIPAIKAFTFSTMDALKNMEKSFEGRRKDIISELEFQLQASIASSIASSHDGTFLWRIPDLGRKTRDAIEGRVTSLYSMPFYTGRNGYKMCLRAYLNGDGIGHKTHLSLFFVMMKGEFDPLLKWPFEEEVTLMLVDQNHRKHVVRKFKPTIDRSMTDMNVASGFPQFAELSVLEDLNYMKDNVMFIKCIVDTTKIFHP